MSRILTINSGSSSIKFALFAAGEPPSRLASGQLERIGLADAVLLDRSDDGTPRRHAINAPDHTHAVAELLRWLQGQGNLDHLAAVGHRVVHGGPHYREARQVTPAVVAELRRLVPLDPAHLPGEIALIEAFERHCPGLPQVVCFDTAFHRDMPRVARLLPIPRHYEHEGVQRYGFHGLSYAYLMTELARVAGPEAARGRIILAHLGNGASMAAVRDGRCIDTTMGFTPTAGLVMGTRCGDLDPGLLVYLLRSEKLNAEQLDDLVNRRSGLLGVSETSSDVRDLLSRRGNDPRAAEAIELFCYQARKWVGALATVLGGLDTLVFAGGIGENSSEVRAGICGGLDFLGLRLDEEHNRTNAPVLSTDSSRVTVRVLRTDEEATIARILGQLLGNQLTRAERTPHDAE